MQLLAHTVCCLDCEREIVKVVKLLEHGLVVEEQRGHRFHAHTQPQGEEDDEESEESEDDEEGEEEGEEQMRTRVEKVKRVRGVRG